MSPRSSSLEFEVDIHGVGATGCQRGGRGVNLRDAFRGGENRLVHERVAARLDEFGARDLSVFFNPDPDRADKRLRLVKNRGRLVPLAVKPVVDELVIPGELGSLAAGTRFRGIAGTLRGVARAMGVGAGF